MSTVQVAPPLELSSQLTLLKSEILVQRPAATQMLVFGATTKYRLFSTMKPSVSKFVPRPIWPSALPDGSQ